MHCRAASVVWLAFASLLLASLSGSSGKAYADENRVDQYGDPLPEGAAMRLGTARLRQPTGSLAVAFSPDGTQLATAGWDGTIKLCEYPGGKPIRQFRGSHRPSGVFGLAFASDGTKLAASCGHGVVYLFDVATGNELIKNTVDRGERTYGIAYAPDGLTFASAGSDGFVRVWDAANGKEVFNVNVPGPGVRDQFAVAYSPDGSLIAAGYSSTIVIIDTRQQSTLLRIDRAHGGQTVSMAFAPDGKTLVSGGFKDHDAGGYAEIRVWNVANGTLVRELSAGPSKNRWCALALSRDGKTLATGHHERVLIWDFPGGRMTRSLEMTGIGAANLGLRTHGLALSPDGKSVASISGGNQICVWNAVDGDPILGFPESHNAGVQDISWFPDGRQLLSASHDGTVRRWDVATGRQTEIMKSTWAWQVSITPDARTIVTGGEQRNSSGLTQHGILRFNDAQLKEQLEAKSLNNIVTALSISPDGSILAAASGRGEPRFPGADKSPVVISLWDVASRKQIGDLPGHTHEIIALRFSRDGKTLLSIAEDATVCRWDVPGKRFLTSRLLKEQDKLEPARLRAAGLTPDLETVVFAAGPGKLLSIQDLSAGGRKDRVEFPGFDWAGPRIAVTQDGRLAAIGGGEYSRYSNSIWVVNLAAGRRVHEFKPDDWPDCLEFSPDGRRLACGTRVGTILIYDLPEKVVR